MDVLKCSYLTQVDKSDLGNELMARPRVYIRQGWIIKIKGNCKK